MSKILKNTTNLSIELANLGKTVEANSQLLLDTNDYLALASDLSVIELTPLINSGDIVVNDGINDLSSAAGLSYIQFPNFSNSIRFLDDTQVSNDLSSTNTQDAIEEVYDRANNHAARHLPNGLDPLTTASATTLSAATTNQTGNANSFARSNHTHLITKGTAVTLTPDQTNAEGSSAGFARADHIHNIPTAAAVSLSATTTNAQGSNASFARSNHTHQITTGTPSQQLPDQNNATGSSANIARADHIHNIPTATPLATFTSNVQGTANSFARSDHRHNTELLNYNVRQTGEVQTNSTNDVQLQNMLITPAAGEYIYIAGASFKHFNSNRNVFFSIYKNNSQESNTLSQFTTGANNQARETQQMWTISGQISMDGTDTIGVRWRSSSGTARAFLRFITLIRVG